MKKLISIVIPCLNEEENISVLHSRLVKIMSSLSKFIGEYILSIQTYVKKRPLVIEKDRINF